MKIEVIDTPEALESYADAWNRLCVQAPQQTPFLSHAWIAAHLEHRLHPQERWFCVLAKDGERLVGVLPLVVSPVHIAGRRHTVLRAPADFHTHSGDALIAPGHESEVLPALLSAATRYHPRHLYIDFTRVPEASGTRAACPPAPAGTSIRPMGRGAYLPIHGDFDGYRASLSGNFRSNLNKARKKLEQLPEVHTRFLSGPDATEAMLPRFMEVEAKSWKGRRGSAIQKSEQLVAFYTDLCRRLSQAGWLEWHLLSSADEIIAANLAIRFNGTVFVWKLGYDEDHAKCSPGGMLFEDLIRRAYQSGDVGEINLLTNHAWYERWRMRWRTYHGIRIYSPRPTAWALWAFDAGRRWAARQEILRRAWTSARPSPI